MTRAWNCVNKIEIKNLNLNHIFSRRFLSHSAFDVHILSHTNTKSCWVVPLLGFRLVAFIFPLLVPVRDQVKMYHKIH